MSWKMCDGLLLSLVHAPWLETKGEAYVASKVKLLGVEFEEAVTRLTEEGTHTLRWVWEKIVVVGLDR
jgi:hypothetical protein